MTDVQETVLATYIERVCSQGHALSSADVCHLAARILDEEKVLEMGHAFFASGMQRPPLGRKWFRGFMKRHAGRLVHATSYVMHATRHANAYPQNFEHFFLAYERVLADDNLSASPDRIWNCDETGIMLHKDRGNTFKRIWSIDNSQRNVNVPVDRRSVTGMAAVSALARVEEPSR